MEIIKDKINIKAGDMTFSQRIGLGKIMLSDISEVEKFERVFKFLHGIELNPDDRSEMDENSDLIDYFREIVTGLAFWIQQESLMKYELTPKERINQDNSTDTLQVPGGTINAIARKYNVGLDDVLNWEYKKVFQILFDDYEVYKRKLYCSKNN